MTKKQQKLIIHYADLEDRVEALKDLQLELLTDKEFGKPGAAHDRIVDTLRHAAIRIRMLRDEMNKLNKKYKKL